MLRTKEIALKNFLEESEKEINQMIKSLDAANDKDCENNITHKACLRRLKKLKTEIGKAIKQHEYGIWVE